MTATETAGDALADEARELIEHLGNGGTLQDYSGLGDEEMEAIYAIAHSQFMARKYGPAADLFRFLCLYDHTEPRWYYGLGLARQHAGDYAGAADALGMAAVLDIDDPRPQVQTGYCLLAMEQWPEARAVLETAITSCGDEPEHAGLKQQAEGLLSAVKSKMANDSGGK